MNIKTLTFSILTGLLLLACAPTQRMVEQNPDQPLKHVRAFIQTPDKTLVEFKVNFVSSTEIRGEVIKTYPDRKAFKKDFILARDLGVQFVLNKTIPFPTDSTNDTQEIRFKRSDLKKIYAWENGYAKQVSMKSLDRREEHAEVFLAQSDKVIGPFRVDSLKNGKIYGEVLKFKPEERPYYLKPSSDVVELHGKSRTSIIHMKPEVISEGAMVVSPEQVEKFDYPIMNGVSGILNTTYICLGVGAAVLAADFYLYGGRFILVPIGSTY